MLDQVNMMFLIGASIFTVVNVVKLCMDKSVRGTSVWSQVFFLVWTFYSIYFFIDLGIWYSLAAETILSATTGVYVYLLFKYRNN